MARKDNNEERMNEVQRSDKGKRRQKEKEFKQKREQLRDSMWNDDSEW